MNLILELTREIWIFLPALPATELTSHLTSFFWHTADATGKKKNILLEAIKANRDDVLGSLMFYTPTTAGDKDTDGSEELEEEEEEQGQAEEMVPL